MSLEQYQEKRNFDKTPEPRGQGMEDSQTALRFVVQKHQASRLHYDFRLELDGVLKSWAVPKGPSLNPSHKRLAVMVEDHPLDYAAFEGTIPEDNYGAGTVMVWDEGTYHVPGSRDRAESAARMRQGLDEGALNFVLSGHKLSGEYALVRFKGAKETDWLLIKQRDQHASDADVTEQDRSAKTGRTLQEIGAQA